MDCNSELTGFEFEEIERVSELEIEEESKMAKVLFVLTALRSRFNALLINKMET